MRRENRHEITKYGWVHKQNNSKIIKNDIESKIIAKEVGLSPYKKVNDKRCMEALDWWDLNRSKWDSVRFEWQKIYDLKNDISYIMSLVVSPYDKNLMRTRIMCLSLLYHMITNWQLMLHFQQTLIGLMLMIGHHHL